MSICKSKQVTETSSSRSFCLYHKVSLVWLLHHTTLCGKVTILGTLCGAYLDTKHGNFDVCQTQQNVKFLFDKHQSYRVLCFKPFHKVPIVWQLYHANLWEKVTILVTLYRTNKLLEVPLTCKCKLRLLLLASSIQGTATI